MNKAFQMKWTLGKKIAGLVALLIFLFIISTVYLVLKVR